MRNRYPLDLDPQVVQWLEWFATIENEPTFAKVRFEQDLAERRRPRDSDDYAMSVEDTPADTPQCKAIRKKIREVQAARAARNE